jgi:YVTN family beta-propeller protein
VKIDLCNSAEEAALGHPPCDGTVTTPNHSAPAGMFWSSATGKIYSNLSGYGTVVEIDPVSFAITRTVDITPLGNTEFKSVGMTPDGRFLWLVGEDIISDPAKVIGKFSLVDLTQPALAQTALPVAGLDHIRPALFQFTPDNQRLYLTQSNSLVGLPFAAQAHALKKDRLLAFDISGLPAAPTVVAEVDLPAADQHGMDLWITGPKGAGSAKGIAVTNATAGVNGSVSLIDASTHTVTATIPVGKNPRQVTVYYFGLAASDNQATPVN